MQKKQDDDVTHPKHYTQHPAGIECISIVEHMNFCLGNAIKYLWRAGLKTEDPLKDLRKAAWYINREIDRIERSQRSKVLDELVKESEELGLYSHPRDETRKTVDDLYEEAYGTSTWIPWYGTPIEEDDDTPVQVRFRDGSLCAGAARSWDWKWYAGESDSDIIAYRVIKQGG